MPDPKQMPLMKIRVKVSQFMEKVIPVFKGDTAFTVVERALANEAARSREEVNRLAELVQTKINTYIESLAAEI